MSQQPYPEPGGFPRLGASRPGVPYLALHPMGFSVPRRLRFARCALTAPFHPYRTVAGPAVSSLWHCPSNGLPAVLPRVSQPNKPGLRGIAPCGVRTFLPRLAPEAILHPPKTTPNYSARTTGTIADSPKIHPAPSLTLTVISIPSAPLIAEIDSYLWRIRNQQNVGLAPMSANV